MCIRAVVDHPFTLKYVPDRYSAEEIYDVAVDDNRNALEFV